MEKKKKKTLQDVQKAGEKSAGSFKAFHNNAWGAQLLFYSRVLLVGPCNTRSALGEPAPTLVRW
jgi:hypothetical protein